MTPLQKLSLGFAAWVALCAATIVFLQWVRKPGMPRAYEKVMYHVDAEHPDMTGYYIVSYNPDGTSYDSVGPYRSREDATRMMLENPIEDAP